MIKVVQVIEDLEVGGAERLVVSLANEISRDQFKPYVVCLAQRGALWDELSSDVERCVLRKTRVVDLAFLVRLVRLIRSISPDVVHTHLFTANTWGRIASLICGQIPTVVTIHNVDSWKGPIHRACDHLLAPSTSAFVGVSRRVLEHAVQYEGVRRSRSRVIYNGIDPSASTRVTAGACRRELHVEEGDFLYGYVGRLVSQKGVDRLLRAFALVLRRVPGGRLVIVGDGPERAHLVALADSLGIGRAVSFLFERRDVPALLVDFNCFVLASLREGLPLSLLEAMAAGVPVVVTGVGGNAEVVADGVDGFIVPPDRIDLMAERMVEMARNGAMRERFATAGRQTVCARFSGEAFLRKMQQLYRELV